MLNELDWSTLLSGATALLALVLSMTLALIIRFRTWRQRWFLRFSALLYISLILFSAASLLEQLLNGKPGNTARFFLQLACIADYLLSGLLAFSFSGLLLFITDPQNERTGLRALLCVIAALQVLLVLAADSTDLLYTLDAQNRYHRSPGYPLALIAPALMLLVDVVILLRSRSRVPRADRLELWGILAIPVADVILQYFLENVTPVAVVAAALLFYAILSRQQVRELRDQQDENLRLRLEILLSEIQPHFMYNTLGAVAELCDTDPARAKKTTLLFSRYLQGVMSGLNTQLVPFPQVLEQLKLYLELARIRFEDALQVEYDVQCTDFEIPSMCLQPLVENAIRHGIRKNKGGRGTLVLRSAERPDCWEITVEDDGPGCDALKPPDRERSQVGLANVREQLRLSCGGSLELRSEAGTGTAAVIRIPKKQEG